MVEVVLGVPVFPLGVAVMLGELASGESSPLQPDTGKVSMLSAATAARHVRLIS
jgi:hypothetical protein